MALAIENYLSKYGPALSNEISRSLAAQQKISPAAARKRVSRARGEVKRLAYLTFPHGARFMYLRQQFGSKLYWTRLIEALHSTKSCYGLALAAIVQRGGIVPVEHFAIASGAPTRQKGHLSPETILDRLLQANLIDKRQIAGVGKCIALKQLIDVGDYETARLRQRLIVEKILLIAIRDWLRKLGIVSYNKVKLRSPSESPQVGTFAWDLSAPSYLGCMTGLAKRGGTNPGFVACDVYLGSEVSEAGIRPFVNKCVTLRKLKRVGRCMQLFVADSYSKGSFQLLKEHGIVPATPTNLFGEEIAEALAELSRVLLDAAQSAIDPERFNMLFARLGKIEGAASQLRGTLFEFLVADIARKTISADIRMNQIFKLENGEEVEADVIAIKQNQSVTLIECKGHNPEVKIPDEEVERWLVRTIPLLYKRVRRHDDWQALRVRFEFWATGKLSETARHLIESRRSETNPNRYTINTCLGAEMHRKCHSIGAKELAKAFKKHFMVPM